MGEGEEGEGFGSFRLGLVKGHRGGSGGVRGRARPVGRERAHVQVTMATGGRRRPNGWSPQVSERERGEEAGWAAPVQPVG
jgi:hypothetical protein